VDGRLPPEAVDRVETHIQYCHRCGLAFDVLRYLMSGDISADEAAVIDSFQKRKVRKESYASLTDLCVLTLARVLRKLWPR